MFFVAIAIALSLVVGGGAYAAHTSQDNSAQGSFDLSTDGSVFMDTRLAHDHEEGVTDPNSVWSDAELDANGDGSLSAQVDGSLEIAI